MLGPTTPGQLLTNNQAEFAAVVLALEALPPGWSGQVCSDSHVTLGRLFARWQMTNIDPAWAARAEQALQRLGPCRPVLLDGHPTRAHLAAGVGKRGHPVSEHNVYVDALCQAAGVRYLRELRAARAS